MDRPLAERREIVPLSTEHCGRKSAEKITSLQKTLKEAGHAGFIVSALDEVAWLFNLRGSDIPFNPLFFAYALVLEDSVHLYLDESKVDVKSAELAGVKIRPYDSIFEDLSAMSKEGKWDGKRKLLVSSSCNAALALAAGSIDVLTVGRSPIETDKAVKNSVELDGFRNCHIRDAAALVQII